MKRVCTVCGTANESAARFCRNCGTPLVTGTEQPPVTSPQAANPRGRGASRQMTFVRALWGGAAVALVGGVALWWIARAPAPSTPQQAATPPVPAPTVITPPPLVKPILLPAQEPKATTPSLAAAEQGQPKQRKRIYRPPAVAHHAPPPQPPAPPPPLATTTPAAAAPPPALQQTQPGDLAQQVAQCKTRHAGITEIFARQRCLWRYCQGQWGQSGCPPKYGKNDNLE